MEHTRLLFLFFIVSGISIVVLLVRAMVHYRAVSILTPFRDKKIIRIESFAECVSVSNQEIISLQGRGILVLTNEVLFFERWISKTSISLMLDAIATVETVLVQVVGNVSIECLKISFKTGSENALGDFVWKVKNPHEWEQTLARVLRGEKVSRAVE